MRGVRQWSACAVLGIFLIVGSGVGAPEKGPVWEEVPLPGQARLAFTYSLKGMVETRVIASGNARFFLGLYVLDAHGNCVAWDDYGGTRVPEEAAVVFVPPADGTYTVVVKNLSPNANQIRLVVR